MIQYVKGQEELAIGWVPIASQATTVNTSPDIILGTTGHGLKWRRFAFVVRNNGLVPVYLCKAGESLATAVQVNPTNTGNPAILGPFDAIAMPYYLMTTSSSAGCLVNVIASEHGEPEQFIAGA